MVIWLNDTEVYNIGLNCRLGTNTRFEVIFLCTLLFCANKLGLKEIRVLGDSRVVLDWIYGCGRLQLIFLNRWLKMIRRSDACLFL